MRNLLAAAVLLEAAEVAIITILHLTSRMAMVVRSIVKARHNRVLLRIKVRQLVTILTIPTLAPSLLDRKALLNSRMVPKVVIKLLTSLLLNGKTTITLSSTVLPNTVLLRTALSLVPSSLLHHSLWHLKTITQIMRPKAINPSLQLLSSMARSSLLNNSNTTNHLSTVLLKAVPHNSSGKDLSMVSNHMPLEVVVVEDLTMDVVVMTLL